ncbi:MAG: hypothetical protein H6625_09095 [Bdellovibrionaceae bacterium]|nr:hypothetical protein [Pseudobdellovibrionaceae bacterium]
MGEVLLPYLKSQSQRKTTKLNCQWASGIVFFLMDQLPLLALKVTNFVVIVASLLLKTKLCKAQFGPSIAPSSYEFNLWRKNRVELWT